MGLAVRRVMMQQNPLPFVGGEQNDPCRFKGPAHLIARRFVNLEVAFGFEAFQRGQRYAGLVSERLLRPTQQRACGPRLSGSDHA